MNDEIREEALKHSWSLEILRKEGMCLETAAKGASEISGDSADNKIGRSPFKKVKKKDNKSPSARKIACYFCGITADKREILAHAKQSNVQLRHLPAASVKN